MGKPTLLWLHGLSCSGNTQSFLCGEDPHPWDVLSAFELLYHPALTWEEDMEEVVGRVLKGEVPLDVFVLEGAVGPDNSEVLRELTKRAGYVIALGNCAVFGNIPALGERAVSGLQFRFKERGGLLGKDFKSGSGYPVINLSGCPAHPSWLSHVLMSILEDYPIHLDDLGRPKDIYASLTHQGCSRNEYFEWKIDAEGFGKKEGCLFYYLGCRGPMTHSSCNRILWNGVSSKTRAGMPCVGCTEYDFPRENLFRTEHLMGVPKDLPEGVSRRGYILLSGVAKTFAPERLKGGTPGESK
ncbi:MAG TPA: Ni/Fe hydrogenase [Aigarchaeota archaeon]|nr:Ni/Fe hydrogenase [Aigarchaeota archaeon]